MTPEERNGVEKLVWALIHVNNIQPRWAEAYNRGKGQRLLRDLGQIERYFGEFGLTFNEDVILKRWTLDIDENF
jgi:hypothetical protein